MKNEKMILTYFKLNEKERIESFIAKSSFDMLKSKKIAVGHAHVAILNDDGTVSVYGNNQYGQCNTKNWKEITKVSAGDFHTVAIKKDGTVLATGDNTYGQCNVENWRQIVDIYANKGLTMGVDSNGEVFFSKYDNNKRYKNLLGKKQHNSSNYAIPSKQESSSNNTNYIHAYEPSTDQIKDKKFEYSKMSDGSLRITRYLGNDSIVCIPSNVTSVGYRAFYGNRRITEVILPESVSILGQEAFASCVNLKEIRILGNITQIGKNFADNETTIICASNTKTGDFFKEKGVLFCVE